MMRTLLFLTRIHMYIHHCVLLQKRSNNKSKKLTNNHEIAQVTLRRMKEILENLRRNPKVQQEGIVEGLANLGWSTEERKDNGAEKVGET